jgi:hypothetical protein
MNVLALLTGVSTVVDAARSLARTVGKSHAAATEKTASSSFEKELEEAVAKLIKARDKNGNGALSLTELGGDKQTFTKLDVNHDGELNAQELKGLFASSAQSGQGAGSITG